MNRTKKDASNGMAHPMDEPRSLGSYEISFEIRRELGSSADYGDFVVDVSGAIHQRRGAGTLVRAGTIHGHVLRVERIVEQDEDVFDVCDAHSQVLFDHAHTLLMPESYELTSKVRQQLGELGLRDLLIVDRVEVLPEHRGRGLGLAATSQFLELFEGGCGVAVCTPYPLQSSPHRAAERGWAEKMAMESFDADHHRALEKLRRHWERLGFQQLGKTKYFVLSLEHVRPTLAQALAGTASPAVTSGKAGMH